MFDCNISVKLIYSRVFLLRNFYTHFRVCRFKESKYLKWLLRVINDRRRSLKGVYNVMVGYVK